MGGRLSRIFKPPIRAYVARCSQYCERQRPSFRANDERRLPMNMTTLDLKHLTQEQLARRWNISPRTLERWRWLKQGPTYLKVGGRVLYRLEDIDAFETRQVHPSG